MAPMTPHERKGLITTLLVHALLLLAFIFLGLKYMEPKPEEGILVNFGQLAEAGGDVLDPAQQEAVSQEQLTEEQPVTDPVEEEILTQETEEAPAVSTRKEEKPKVEQPKETPKPTVDARLSGTLKNLGNNPGGEGEKTGAGDQGSPDGDPTSPNYSGTGGGGGGNGNYLLGNRQALSTPKPEYNCPDQGRVVVAVYVDRSGKVIRATPGERIPGGKSTTTTSQCLFEKAKAAALRTHWQGDPDAPDLQKGYIIYNFEKQ